MHPDQFARHREHQHDRVLGDRGRVGAAIVADRHAGGAGGFEIVGVVAGAQGLHELQLRRLGVEFRAVLELAGADIEIGILQQVPEFRPAVRRGHQLQPVGQHVVGDLHRLVAVAVGGQNAVGHGCVSSAGLFSARHRSECGRCCPSAKDAARPGAVRGCWRAGRSARVRPVFPLIPSTNMGPRRCRTTTISTTAFRTCTSSSRSRGRTSNRNNWDYLIGASESETTLARNRLALDSIGFRPRVLRDVSNVDVSREMFGRKLRIPVLCAPVGSLGEFRAGRRRHGRGGDRAVRQRHDPVARCRIPASKRPPRRPATGSGSSSSMCAATRPGSTTMSAARWTTATTRSA